MILMIPNDCVIPTFYIYLAYYFIVNRFFLLRFVLMYDIIYLF